MSFSKLTSCFDAWRRCKLLSACFVLLFVAFCFSESEAVGQTFIGPNNGLWSDDANWDMGVAPTSGDANLTISYAGPFISSTLDYGFPFELQSFVFNGTELGLGSSASSVGFATDGNIEINDNTLTLFDATSAQLGTSTTIGLGTSRGALAVGNALVSDSHDHLLLTNGRRFAGLGNVIGHFKNNGIVSGDGRQETERIIFEEDWRVIGNGQFNNTTVLGIFTPGESHGVSTGSNQGFGGAIEFELGGIGPGAGSGFPDQIIDSGTVQFLNSPTLQVLAFENFMPEVGYEFTVMTWASGRIGTVGEIEVGSFYQSQGVTIESVISGDTFGAGSLALHVIAVTEPGADLALCIIGLGLPSKRRRSLQEVVLPMRQVISIS